MAVNLGWFTIIGLVFDLAAAIVLGYDLMVSQKEAIELGVSRVSGSTDEENLQLPQVRDRLKQSRKAKIGMVLLAIGFAFQIVGSWPR